MRESHSLSDRAKELGAFTHHGDPVRLTGRHGGPPREHQAERGEEAERVLARQGEELAAYKTDGVRLPAQLPHLTGQQEREGETQRVIGGAPEVEGTIG